MRQESRQATTQEEQPYQNQDLKRIETIDHNIMEENKKLILHLKEMDQQINSLLNKNKELKDENRSLKKNLHDENFEKEKIKSENESLKNKIAEKREIIKNQEDEIKDYETTLQNQENTLQGQEDTIKAEKKRARRYKNQFLSAQQQLLQFIQQTQSSSLDNQDQYNSFTALLNNNNATQMLSITEPDDLSDQNSQRSLQMNVPVISNQLTTKKSAHFEVGSQPGSVVSPVSPQSKTQYKTASLIRYHASNEALPLSPCQKSLRCVQFSLHTINPFIASLTESFFRIGVLEQLTKANGAPITLSLPATIGFAAIMAILGDFPLEQHEAREYFLTLDEQHGVSYWQLWHAIKNSGTVAALVPALAELALFYTSVSRQLSFRGGSILALLGAVSAFFQYLLMEGGSLQRLLDVYLLEADMKYQQESLSRWVWPCLILTNIAMFVGAAAYLLPIYEESHPSFHNVLRHAGIAEEKVRSLSVMLSVFLCACYLGGQVCLFGAEFKELSYEKWGLFRKALVTKGSQKDLLLVGMVSVISVFFSALPVGAVAYYFFTIALRGLCGISGNPWGLVTASLLLSLPAFLQSGATKGFRLLESLYRLQAWWQQQERSGFSKKLNELLATDFNDLESIASGRSLAYGGGRLLSFKAFYLGLVGLVIVSAPKLLFELADPKESPFESAITHLIGAVMGCITWAVVDCRLIDQGVVHASQLLERCKPSSFGRFAQNLKSLKHLKISYYIGLFTMLWSVGLFSQWLGRSYFFPVKLEHEFNEYLSESFGSLCQGMVAMLCLAIHLYHLQINPPKDHGNDVIEPDLDHHQQSCWQGCCTQLFKKVRARNQEQQQLLAQQHKHQIHTARRRDITSSQDHLMTWTSASNH